MGAFVRLLGLWLVRFSWRFVQCTGASSSIFMSPDPTPTQEDAVEKGYCDAHLERVQQGGHTKKICAGCEREIRTGMIEVIQLVFHSTFE